MANTKISALNAITGVNAASGDLIPIVDVSATETKSITRLELFTSPPAIGGTTPAAGTFTTLTSTGNAALGDAEATDTHAIKGATTLLANSASAALTVTQTGAGNAFVVEDSASTDATPFVIDGAGRVITGGTASVSVVGLAAAIQNFGQDGHLVSAKFGNDAFGSYSIIGKSRNATVGSQTIVQNGDEIGTQSFVASDGTQFLQAARIQAFVDGTPGTNDMPGRLVFSTTADGASSPTERMRIDSAGLTTARNSTGLGYGTGSGGTVTQATSKATAVTLNKAAGQITTAADALASGASVDFTLNNTCITGADVVAFTFNSGGSSGAYTVSVSYSATGSCGITLKNISGGSLSQAVVINFVVIKGATS